MKELSIEEKAKRYDIAVEQIRELRDMLLINGVIKNDGIINSNFQRIFPQLNESKDDRAKKEITELVMQPTWKTAKEFHRRRELCAWLEKQGQVKDSAISQHENKTCKENDDSLTNEDERIRKEMIEILEKEARDFPSSVIAEKSNSWIAWHEKRGESKPIGKLQLNEVLYEHIRNTCACIDDALSSETLADTKDYLSMAKHSAQNAFDMIEKQGEHAKFRDSIQVGDKVTRNEDGVLVNLSQLNRVAKKQGKNNMGISEATKQKLEDNLHKALEKETPESWNEFLDEQGEHKPWSEEDEDILNTIINHFKVDIECTDEDDTVRWLKSLKERYIWKPSDEQINTLFKYAEQNNKDGSILTSLYQQLKKIREG